MPRGKTEHANGYHVARADMIGFFLLLISMALLICFAGNYYIFARMFELFGFRRGLWFWVIVITFALSFVGTRVLEAYFSNIVLHLFRVAATNWLGIGLILLCCVFVNDIIRIFVKPDGTTSAWVIIAITAGLSVYSIFNAKTLRVKELELTAPVDMTVVQLSDIHVGSVRKDFLAQIVAKVNTLSPDVVLITGDLMEPRNKLTTADMKALDGFDAPVFFVTGNHDRYAGLANVMRLLGDTKVKVLRDSTVELDDIQLIGIDDPNEMEDTNYVKRKLANIEIDDSKYSILLFHQPKGFADAARAGVDLMLSGHTHGGQIFPSNFPIRIKYKYFKGLYEMGDSKLFVSTGTGTWGPRMRLGSSSEIVLIKLHKPKDL